MTKVSVELDYETVDRIVFNELRDMRIRMIEDYGAGNNVFAWQDIEQDNEEILRHIRALEVILEYCGTPEQLTDYKRFEVPGEENE
jgi:uncharacterized protein with HEPN domain